MTRHVVDDETREELKNASRRSISDPFCIFSTSPEETDDALADAFAQKHASVRRYLIDHLEADLGSWQGSLDLVGAQLLRHVGVDPVAVCALLTVCMQPTIMVDGDHEDDTAIQIRRGVNNRGGHVRLAPGCWWRFGGTVETALPETQISSLQTGDYLLHDVVSHPILDRHTLAITGVELDWKGEVVIKTNYQWKPIGLNDITRI